MIVGTPLRGVRRKHIGKSGHPRTGVPTDSNEHLIDKLEFEEGVTMNEAIVVALITGGMSLVGVIITCMATSKKTERAAAVAQAVTDTKIDELTREVRLHNGFAQRMPVVEEQIKVINHRLSDLERSAE